ncbi:ATP-binding cassette domain-containing protein [Brooklawnia cerclae]|uniref:ABC-type branched-subunit amino acid transport system ATPase component n=1 Tax=Brooklawnia cerclae TaxID=349934 RepID=A0ABX0SIU1_9ACTN|nr:ATP-binding cassette domain-containing protein [Brooklawnia cerclae]NIH57895.1 ABC-type branched-subunit amino acid transport system ATPase component [Brooklawnia cerclae]
MATTTALHDSGSDGPSSAGIDAALLGDDRQPVLSVRDLHKSFDGVHAVDGLSFDVAEGEVVSIIGPNGSGKSTTINLLSGLLNPDSGTISFGEVRLERRDPVAAAEAGIARTFQNGRVFGALSVADNVQLGLHKQLRYARPLRGLSGLPVLRWASLLGETALALVPGPRTRAEARQIPTQVDEQLTRFGERLLPRRHDRAYTLSYANRRRTEIARALVSHPRLLLLDEPTAGMNQSETAEVLDQLRELKAAGQTIVLVEHKVDLVLAISDRVLVMDNGRLIAAGEPLRVRNDPAVIEAYLGRRRVQARERSRAQDDAEPEQPHRPLLELRDVDVYYGAVHALRNVSITVGEGEIVSLLGGNASGKSTTMKTILGLVNPRQGQVRFDDRDLRSVDTPHRVRSGIATVPEARRVFPEMTVQENLLIGAYTRTDRAGIRDDLAAILDHFPRLAERRDQAAGTMSGGEQQMLAFGRALMSKPRLICMDEPTMGLAPLLVEQVLEEIARLRDELGLAVLIVEQQAELALSIADRGYVLANGGIVLQGTAEQLLNDTAIQEAYLGRGSQAKVS